ncbi:hypothetical protein B0H63DRAFT_418942 [Podospora didyma]|uniref:Heterokaryon incompatibility domain-containing protein n=1 Tax=Podospora didyma TaxID=330526 RepID=A0AAE0KEY1_9PEZI|nr:hypothetical protein B0H63DRAFT_418942 [Podospora didyma]
MPISLRGTPTQFFMSMLKEDERTDPFNTKYSEGPNWGYILEPSEPDPVARLRRFLALPQASISLSGRHDSKFGKAPAIHVAVRVANHAALQCLLDNAASIEESRNAGGAVEHNTPLIIAAMIGNVAAADILLGRGANLEARNASGQTPLHAAVMEAKLDMVKHLLARGADVSATKQTESVLHLAVRSGRASMVQFFVDLGREAESSTGSAPWPSESKEGTPFDLACAIRAPHPFWTLVLDGMDKIGNKKPVWPAKAAEPVERGKLPLWADGTLALPLHQHPIAEFLVRHLLSQTFPESPNILDLPEYCENCLAVAASSPDDCQPREGRLLVWRKKGMTFNYGYLTRCQHCRGDLMDVSKWLPDVSSTPAKRASAEGRSYVNEEDFQCLMEANKTMDEMNTNSPAINNFVAYWMLRCLKSHSECASGKSPVLLPRFLIDVGVEPQSNSPFLHETSPGETGFYFTLSYRWGPNPLATCRENVAAYKRAIPVESIPPIIRDAMVVTKQLGCRYLWVDALCIVQDDYEQKEAEISSMEETYRNSTLTIAAAIDTAESPDMGLFHPRNPKEPRQNVYIGERRDNVLDTRGWILQEQVLSSRLLTYSPTGEVRWTCNGVEANCNHPSGHKEKSGNPNEKTLTSYLQREPRYRKMNKFLNGMGLPDKWENNMHDLWMILVTDFTHRGLSVENDRLAALAGISSGLERLLGDELLAGHWRSQLANSLAWCVDPDMEVGLPHRGAAIFNRGTTSRNSSTFSGLGNIPSIMATEPESARTARPNTFRAPSWSWASVLGPVSYSHRFFSTGRGAMWKYSPTATGDGTGSSPYVTVLDASIAVDHTTRTISGALTLQGSIFVAKTTLAGGAKAGKGKKILTLSVESFCAGGGCSDGGHALPQSHGIVSKKWFPDVTMTMEEIPEEIYCFHIVDELSLCLVPTGSGKKDEFRRVGLCDWKSGFRKEALELECDEIMSHRLRYIRNKDTRWEYLRERDEKEYVQKKRRAGAMLQTVVII